MLRKVWWCPSFGTEGLPPFRGEASPRPERLLLLAGTGECGGLLPLVGLLFSLFLSFVGGGRDLGGLLAAFASLMGIVLL